MLPGFLTWIISATARLGFGLSSVRVAKWCDRTSRWAACCAPRRRIHRESDVT
jgi:hypothetical protein